MLFLRMRSLDASLDNSVHSLNILCNNRIGRLRHYLFFAFSLLSVVDCQCMYSMHAYPLHVSPVDVWRVSVCREYGGGNLSYVCAPA